MPVECDVEYDYKFKDSLVEILKYIKVDKIIRNLNPSLYFSSKNFEIPKNNNNHFNLCRYYDMEFGQCFAFAYAGCGGNANRFDSTSHCHSSCSMRKYFVAYLKNSQI